MGLISDLIDQHRKAKVNRALEATLRPDPAYRDRRLAQFTPERRARYERNIAGL